MKDGRSRFHDVLEAFAFASRATRTQLARSRPWALVGAVTALAMADYACRAAHVITSHDPAELQVLALTGGIPHGTSYPLYMALLRLFTRLPLGSFPFRCNLFSVVCAGIALVAAAQCTMLIDARDGRSRAHAGALAAALIASSFTMTRVAIFTGMYTLHLAMLLIVIALLARWVRDGAGRDVEGAMGLLGVMLGNHVMTLALYPGALFLILATLVHDRRDARKLRGVVRGIGWGVLGFLVGNVGLFFLQWLNRVPFDHWGIISSSPKYFDIDPSKTDSFGYAWWYETTCRQFRFDIAGASPSQRWAQLRTVLPGIAAELSPAVVLLAMGGAVLAFLRNKRIATFLFVVVATHIVLATGYTATIKTGIYLLPVTVIVAILAASAAVWMGRAVQRFALARAPTHSRIAVAIAATTMGLLVFAHWSSRRWLKGDAVHRDEPVRDVISSRLDRRPDEHDESTMYQFAERVAPALPSDAIVFADWSQMFALHYVLKLERGEGGVTIQDPYPYGGDPIRFPVDYAEWIADQGRTRPVFFISPLVPPPLEGMRLISRTNEVSELVRVAP